MGVKRERETEERLINEKINTPYNFEKGKLKAIGPLLANA